VTHIVHLWNPCGQIVHFVNTPNSCIATRFLTAARILMSRS
jgi:hypothetical protein